MDSDNKNDADVRSVRVGDTTTFFGGAEDCGDPLCKYPACCFDKYDGFGRIYGLYVPHPFRGQGWAKRLIDAAMMVALEHSDVREIYIEALPYADRPVSIESLASLYHRVGFRRVAGHPYAMVLRLNPIP